MKAIFAIMLFCGSLQAYAAETPLTPAQICGAAYFQTVSNAARTIQDDTKFKAAVTSAKADRALCCVRDNKLSVNDDKLQACIIASQAGQPE